MPGSHRHSDTRICGATTTVVGQTDVFVNSLLWSVVGDPNTHGGGDLLLSGDSSPGTVYINGIQVIVGVTDASPDSLCYPIGEPHCNPKSIGVSGNVFAYG